MPTKQIKLTVEGEYVLPTWYQTASPMAVGDALTSAAGGMAMSVAVAEVRADALREREAQLRAHEAQIQRLMDQTSKALEEQRRRIDQLTKEQETSQRRVHKLVHDNDDLQERLDAVQDGTSTELSDEHERVKDHFQQLGIHSEELLKALAQHHALIHELNQSAIALRAKVFRFYRKSKGVNQDVPWLQASMLLPFEQAFQHAIGRDWNNVTHAKARLIEEGLGKAAAQLCMKEEGV